MNKRVIAPRILRDLRDFPPAELSAGLLLTLNSYGRRKRDQNHTKTRQSGLSTATIRHADAFARGNTVNAMARGEKDITEV